MTIEMCMRNWLVEKREVTFIQPLQADVKKKSVAMCVATCKAELLTCT